MSSKVRIDDGTPWGRVETAGRVSVLAPEGGPEGSFDVARSILSILVPREQHSAGPIGEDGPARRGATRAGGPQPFGFGQGQEDAEGGAASGQGDAI